MEKKTIDNQRQKVITFLEGFCAMYLMDMGINLQIFKHIPSYYKPGISIDELFVKTGLNRKYFKIWILTAFHIGLINVDDKQNIKMAEWMNELLSNSQGPLYFGNWVNFAVEYLPAIFNDFSKNIIQKTELKSTFKPQNREKQFSKKIALLSDNALPYLYTTTVPELVPNLKSKLSAGVHILDIGCGKGRIMLELVKKFRNSTFVGIDIDPFIVESANNYINENGFGAQIKICRMDAEFIEYFNLFDYVNMSISLHEIEASKRLETFKKVYASLKMGGEIIIVESDWPDTITSYADKKYKFAILEQFFETSWGSSLITKEEKEKLLLKAGFSDVQSFKVPTGLWEITIAKKI